MRLAVSPSSPGVAANDLVGLCVEAERLGYGEAWLAEVAGPESFSLAGAVGAATSAMSIGIAVVPASTRTPALLAMGAATISQLLGGRELSLGIGSSSQVIVETWHGAEFAPPLARVRETVEATRALLAGERSYDGHHVKADRFALATPPSGPVRLFVGALGPRMLRLAGAIGDGVCLNLMPPDVVPRQLAEIRLGAEEAERDLPDHFRVMARFHTVLTDDLDGGRNAVRAGFGPYFAQPVYNRFLGWCGHPQAAAAVVDAFAAGDRAGVSAALTDEIVDGVALVGTPERVLARLSEYASAGVDVGALNLLGPPELAAEGLRALAPAPTDTGRP
jgi:probable F420-dependent oxidoreductase